MGKEEEKALNEELFEAINNNSYSNAVDLVQKGANVNAVNNINKTALRLAIEIGDEKIIELLIKNNANVNENISSGFTLLNYAIQMRSSEVIKLLLDNNALHNTIDGSGSTPLHHAVEMGSLDIVKELIKKGANPYIENLDNLSSINIAVLWGNNDIIIALLENTNTSYDEGVLRYAIAQYRSGSDEIHKLLSSILSKSGKDSLISVGFKNEEIEDIVKMSYHDEEENESIQTLGNIEDESAV